MGTRYSFDGESIEITPPLNNAEIRKAEAALLKLTNSKRTGSSWGTVRAEDLWDHLTFCLKVEEYTRETDEGILTGRRGVSLTTSDYLNGWISMADEINTIADACPGHTFNGEVCVITEDNQSAMKVVAKDVCAKGNRAEVVKGKVYIKFEDGSELDGDF